MPFTIPSGRKVVIAGSPVIEELTVEGSGVKPGRLVKKGTAATQVVVVAAATDKPSGWVGWEGEGTHQRVSPATRDTAYTAADNAPIIYGPGTILVGKLASGQNVTKDTPLIPAANGELQAAAQHRSHRAVRHKARRSNRRLVPARRHDRCSREGEL